LINEFIGQQLKNSIYLIVNQIGSGASYYLNDKYGYSYGYYGKNSQAYGQDGYYTSNQETKKSGWIKKIKSYISWDL
jgi:phage-related tail protein